MDYGLELLVGKGGGSDWVKGKVLLNDSARTKGPYHGTSECHENFSVLVASRRKFSSTPAVASHNFPLEYPFRYYFKGDQKAQQM